MTPTQVQIQAEFQRQLDDAHDDETLQLGPPRERPGPVTLRRRIALDGQGCAVWGVASPVLTVVADGATLSNLRVEYTADSESAAGGVALRVEGGGLTLENVTVRGSVVGLAEEEGEWRYPHQLNLGALAAGMPHVLTLRLMTPVPCQLTSEVAGVRLEPRSLSPGAHEVRLLIEQMVKDTLVVGTIGIKTAFLRREIVLNAHVLPPTDGLPPPAVEQGRIVWQPLDWDLLRLSQPKTPARQRSTPPDPPPPPPPPPPPVVVPPAPAAAPPPVAPAPSTPPPVTTPPVAPPPVIRSSRKTVRPQQVLGNLFTSPPVGTPPVASPPLTSPPVKSPALGSAFTRKPPPAATEKPVDPPAPPSDATAAPVEAPASPPAKRKLRPAAELPSWAKPPKPPGNEPPES